jgi:uncharacterized protein YndB with AHSA1/START domain
MKSLLAVIAVVGWLGGIQVRAQGPGRSAKLHTSSPVSVTRAATMRITVALEPTAVFDYFSDSAKLVRWFPDQAIFEPQIGDKYHFRWNNADAVWSGVVTEYLRGSRLAFTWEPPDEAYETNVRINLLPQGNETIVEVTHTGFTSVGMLDKAIEAWRIYLENLKSVIETGTDMRRKASPRHAPTRARHPAA